MSHQRILNRVSGLMSPPLSYASQVEYRKTSCSRNGQKARSFTREARISPRRRLDATVIHEADKAACQFIDPFCLAHQDSFRRNQLSAHAKRRGACQNEIEGCELIHASCGNQRYLRKGASESSDITLTSQLCAWDNFYKV